MSLKSRLMQLSAIGVATTTLFATPKDKNENDRKLAPITAPANIPAQPSDKAQKDPTSQNDEIQTSSLSQNNDVDTKQSVNPVSESEVTTNENALSKETSQTQTEFKKPNRKMNEDELEAFMQTTEYTDWRDKLGKRWLLGMSHSVSEGFCPWGYMCSKGVLTIGHGIATTNGMDFSKFPLYFENGTRMTEKQISQYFDYVKRKAPTTKNAKEVAHSFKVKGSSSKIAGMRYKDSLQIATREVSSVIDTFYKLSYKNDGIDFMKEPYAVQMLATDIGYQVGPHNLVSKWPNFMNAIKNKKYHNLKNQVSTKEGTKTVTKNGKKIKVRQRNQARHTAKQLLAELAVAQATNDQIKCANITNELYMVGANIYNLKFRSAHNPRLPKTLKKRDVGGFPKEVQKTFNIDEDGNKLVKKTTRSTKKNTRRGTRKRKNNMATQQRRSRGR